ncbi:MAG: MFS transporter [Vallitaleaceae bacterium]|nr:MFS transporter [Vallitaleaceae bacterium]
MLLKDAPFRRLMIGRTISMLGSNVQQFVLALYVLHLTGSATLFASVMAIAILPRLILSPFAGVFGDWFDRKKSIVSIDFINAIFLIIFCCVYFIKDGLSVPMVFILVLGLEATEVFFGSAMAAVLPSIVEKEKLLEASSISSLSSSISQMLAPLIGALIYGWMGMQLILVLNALSFIVSALCEMKIPIPSHHKRPKKLGIGVFWKDLLEGLSVMRQNRFIRMIVFVAMMINFCIAPVFSVGLIYVVKEVLVSSDVEYGLFQTVLAIGMISAPLMFAKPIKKIPIGRLLMISFIAISCSVGVISLLTLGAYGMPETYNKSLFIGVLLAAAIISMSATVANIAVGTIFNLVTPLEVMGRTATVLNLLCTIAIPIGTVFMGILLDHFSAYVAIGVAGIGLIVTLIVSARNILDSSPQTDSNDELEIIEEI